GIASFGLQADGKIIVAGNFNRLGGVERWNIARLNPDGSLDSTFDPRAEGQVTAVALQPDGKVVVGGGFTALDGRTRDGLARLNAVGVSTQQLTFDGVNAIWFRGGCAPEIPSMSFEASTNSLDWASLGAGERVAEGWQFSPVHLPTNHPTLRAQGPVTG